MGPTRAELQVLFEGMSDEELESRVRGRGLTEIAHAVAIEEMGRRQLAPPPMENSQPEPRAEERPFVLLRRYADVMDAQTLRARLEAEGIPVLLGAANHAVAMGFFSPALGGTRVEVPEDLAPQARDVMEAFDAGKLMLEDEPGVPVETPGDGVWSTDRRRLREIAVIGLVLLFAGANLLQALVALVREWQRYGGEELLPYWPYLFPALYFAAAIVFAMRSKWALVLFGIHLVGALGVQIAWSLMDESLIVIGQGTVLASGLILAYGFYQVAQGRWR
jgi:hypothetical protein